MASDRVDVARPRNSLRLARAVQARRSAVPFGHGIRMLRSNGEVGRCGADAHSRTEFVNGNRGKAPLGRAVLTQFIAHADCLLSQRVTGNSLGGRVAATQRSRATATHGFVAAMREEYPMAAARGFRHEAHYL